MTPVWRPVRAGATGSIPPLSTPGPPGQVFMERPHLSDCMQPGAGKMRPQEALIQKIIAHRDTLPVGTSREAHGVDGPWEASCSPGGTLS